MYYQVAYSTLQTLKTNCICKPSASNISIAPWRSPAATPCQPTDSFQGQWVVFLCIFYPSPTVRLEVSTSWKYRNHNIPKTLWCLCLQQLGCTWRVYCCHFLMEGAVKQGHHVRMPLHHTLCSESITKATSWIYILHHAMYSLLIWAFIHTTQQRCGDSR